MKSTRTMKAPLSQSFIHTHSSLRSDGVDRFRLLLKGWGLKVVSLLVVLMVGGVSWGQTSTQNFGTTTGSNTLQTGSTTLIAAPTVGTTYARAGTVVPNAPVVLATASNPLGTIGAYARCVASANTSVTKMSPIVGYTSGLEFYTSFKVLFGDASASTTATSGVWSFFQGAGANYSDNQTVSTAQVFTGLSFTFGASGALTLTYNNNGTYNSTSLTTSSFRQGTVYTIEIVGNNKSSGTISYTYGGNSQTVAIQKFDLYINGTKVGDDLTKGTLPANTSINATSFTGVSSTSNAANIFVDDVTVNNAVPATITGNSSPAAPTIGSITPGNGQLSVPFTAGATGGTAITDYKYSTDGGATFTSAASTSSPIVITGLTNGTSYNVQLKAVNSVGDGTATASTAATPATTPSAPTIGTITPTNQSLSVAFTAGATGGSAITNYKYSTDGGTTFRTRAAGTTASPLVISTLSTDGTTALTNGTSYNIQIKAVNGIGDGTATASTAATPRTVPNAPTIGTASVTGVSGTASISFTSPSSNGGSAITSYTATSSPGGITGTISQAGSGTITVFGLTNGTEYTFTVTATNAAGTGSASSASNSVTPYTVPGTPTIGTATVSGVSGTASVPFTAPGSNGGSAIASYTATSSPGGITGTLSQAGSGTITVTGLANGTAYTFTVKATNAAGAGAASAASNSVTPYTTPDAPTIGTAVAGNTSADVAFTAPTFNGGSAITSYTVTSNPDGITGTGSSSPITVNGLTNGTAYTFTVTATNAAGTGSASAASNSVTPTAGATVPGAPTIGTATRGNTQATVSFIAPASDGGDAITSYTVTSNPGSFTASGSSSPLTVTSLINGTAYTFTVIATNSIGNSLASSTSNSVTPATTPGVPTITGITIGNTQLSVAFSAPSSDGGSAITSYKYSTDGGTSFRTRATGTTASPFLINTLSTDGSTALTNGTSYNVQILAVNDVGDGTATGTTAATPATTPGAPTIGTITAGNGMLSVAFTAGTTGGTAISSYKYSTDGGISFRTRAAGTTASPIHISTLSSDGTTALTNGTSYNIQIKAVNAQGDGTATGTTAAAPVTTPGAPTIGTATAGNTSVSIAFTAPASTGGAAITSYTATSNPGGFTGTGSSSPISVTGLTNGTPYTFTVTATNTAGTGTASSASTSSTPRTVPDAPTIGTAAVAGTSGTATVTFMAPVFDGGASITSYTVTSNPAGGTGSINQAGSGTITVSGLTNGTAYTFTVTATNTAGASAASAASNSVTPYTVPSAPTIGTATAGNGQATVTFTAPASNGGSAITSYIATSTPGSFTGTLNQAGSGTITVTGLTNGTAYTFTVKANNAAGASAASVASNSVTPFLPAPLATAASSVLVDGFTANWDAVTSATGYKLDVSTSSNFSTTTSTPNTQIVNNTGSTGASGWTETSITSQGSGTYLGMLSASSTLITPSMDLATFTDCSLNFKARTFGGPSAAQATITVSISVGGAAYSVLGTRQPTTTTLTALTAFDLSAYSGSTVKIKFETLGAGSSKGVGIDDIIVAGTQAVVTPSFVSGYEDLTVSGTSQAVTALSEATTYYYRVRATDAGSTSANSNVITVTTKQTPTVTPTVGTYTYTGSAQGPNAATNTGTGTSYTFSYAGTGATTYGASSTRPTAVGTYTVTASVAADGNYVAASSSATAFSIAKASSTISVSGTTSFTYSGSAQGPSTSTVSGSTGAVTYSYANSGGTTYGPSATAPTNAGSYTVTATVAADANYETASSSATAFTISKASQTITFASTNSVINGVADFAPGATSATSGINAITYTSSNLSVATIVSGNIHTTGVGQTTITASQASSTNYNAATNAMQTLTVNPASAVAYSGTQFTSARNITRGTTELPIYRFQVDVTNADALLNTLTFTTPASITNSNYVNTDITNFKAFLTTSTTFSNSNPLGIVSPSGKVQSNLGEIGISFTSLNTTLSYSTQTYYIWLTADVLSGAVAGRNIIVNAPTIDITGTVSGTTSATGTQTIQGVATNYYLNAGSTNLTTSANYNTSSNGVGTSLSDAGLNYQSNDVILNIPISVTNTGDFTLGNGSKIVVQNGGSLTVGSSNTITGTIDVNDGGTLTVNSTSVLHTLGTLGASSTVIYSANGNQTVTTKPYAHLTLSGSGIKTVGAATVSGTLSLNAGTLDLGSNTFVINGTISQTSGIIDADAGTVSFGNSADMTLTTSLFNGTIYHLSKSSGSGILTLNDNLNITNLSTSINTGAIVLASTKQLTVDGIIDNNGTLTIENGATLKQTGSGANANTGSGTYNVKQDITGSSTTSPNGRFWYLGSPLSDGSSSALLSNSNQLWQWNEGSFGYSLVTSGNLSQGKSYVLRSGQNETINFSGSILSNGTVTVSNLTRTGTSQQFRGCHLVSNPYPSYLDWDMVDKTNVSTTMYVRTASGTNYNILETYNSSDHIGTSISGPEMTNYIAPMQGFWVKVTADNLTGSLTMNNTMRDHQTSGAGLRSSAIDFPAFLRFNIIDGQNKDQVILFMSPDATAGIDGHDSEKMSATGFAQFYSTVNAKKLVINGMKNVKAKTSVPLTLEMPTSKSYTFQAEEFNIEDGLILLEDKQEGVIQDLTINPTYSFFGNAGTNTTRFVVHFQLAGAPVLVGGPMELESLGSDELTTDNIQIVSNNQGTVIIRLDEGFKPEGSIRIFDASGRLVDQSDFNDQETTIHLNEQAGMYFVEVSTGKLMVKKKIVIE